MLTVPWKSVTNLLRQAAAVVGLVVSIGNFNHLGGSAQSVLMAISGSVLVAEHYAQAQSGGTSNPPTPGGPQ